MAARFCSPRRPGRTRSRCPISTRSWPRPKPRCDHHDRQHLGDAADLQAHPEGFDYSIQAGTKYFGGHSDLLIGSISASERAWNALANTRENLGLQAGTEEIFLTLRGIRSLRVRLDQHEKSALEIAAWLEAVSPSSPK
jgi:hypothetical protein